MKVVIIGGVAGGATAAARLRRLDERAEIVIYERTGYVSYANCGLPYHISDTVRQDDLALQSPEGLWARYRIRVCTHHEVTAIDRDRHTVTVRSLDTGEVLEDGYDKLLLSPGATPVLPDFYKPDPRVFTLRTVEDATKLRAFVKDRTPRTAIVVGGGFIGLEVAENLVHAGVRVTVVQRGKRLFPIADRELAAFVHDTFCERGVRLRLQTDTVSMHAGTDGVTLNFADGDAEQADLVVVAIGVRPESGLAAKAGLALDERGAIRVDAQMRTSDPDIYAVGDAVAVRHGVTGEQAVIALAGPANKQGRIAADGIAGLDSAYVGSYGSSVIKLFDATVAATGLSEEAARRSGYDCESILLSPLSHAGYYPGATVMLFKLIFDKKTQAILGAQIAGYDGVDKRIDVVATAIRAGLTAPALATLDLAYAPPYSSAKDPVVMAGFVADNIVRGIVKQFGHDEIAALRARTDVTLLDTRTVFEYAHGHADGFVNIPLDELRDRLDELDRTKPVYVMCQSGMRSYLATRILTQNGFDAYNYRGGYRLYASLERDRKLARHGYPCGMDATD